MKSGGRRQDAEALTGVNVVAGLDMFVERGDWEACMARAEKEGGQVLIKYAALNAARLLQQGAWWCVVVCGGLWWVVVLGQDARIVSLSSHVLSTPLALCSFN